jgi:hypothetical protein
MEVFVLCNEHAIVLARKLPDALIAGTASAEYSNVQRTWKEVVEQREQLFGELLVEEQAHHSGSGDRLRSSLPLRRVRETRPDVFAHQLRKVLEDLIFGRACRKIPEHITDGNPSPTYTRLAEAHLRIDADSIEQAHDYASLRQFGNNANRVNVPTTWWQAWWHDGGGQGRLPWHLISSTNVPTTRFRSRISGMLVKAFDLRLSRPEARTIISTM